VLSICACTITCKQISLPDSATESTDGSFTYSCLLWSLDELVNLMLCYHVKELSNPLLNHACPYMLGSRAIMVSACTRLSRALLLALFDATCCQRLCNKK
jgi:hypothetical protein